MLSVDGLNKVNRVDIGLVLTSPEGDLILRAIHCGFGATNNEAKYEPLIARLILAKDMGIKKLNIYSTPNWWSTNFLEPTKLEI